jgi:hypothetical protein
MLRSRSVTLRGGDEERRSIVLPSPEGLDSMTIRSLAAREDDMTPARRLEISVEQSRWQGCSLELSEFERVPPRYRVRALYALDEDGVSSVDFSAERLQGGLWVQDAARDESAEFRVVCDESDLAGACVHVGGSVGGHEAFGSWVVPDGGVGRVVFRGLQVDFVTLERNGLSVDWRVGSFGEAVWSDVGEMFRRLRLERVRILRADQEPAQGVIVRSGPCVSRTDREGYVEMEVRGGESPDPLEVEDPRGTWTLAVPTGRSDPVRAFVMGP